MYFWEIYLLKASNMIHFIAMFWSCSARLYPLAYVRCYPELVLIGTRVADAHHFNADPDPTFHLNANPDPAHHQSDGNLQPMVYRTLKGPILSLNVSICERPRPSTVPCWASEASNFYFNMDPDPAFTLMRARIQLAKIMLVRIRNPAEYYDTYVGWFGDPHIFYYRVKI